MFKKKKGYTLVEVIAVMAIIAVLTIGVGVVSVRNVRKANIDQTASDLQIFSTNMGDAYYEIGAPIIDPAGTDGSAQFQNYLTELQDSYMNCTFDMASIEATSNGFKVDFASPTDAFDNQFTMWCTTKEGLDPYIMIVSGGPDGAIDTSNYDDQDYGDDIVMIIHPKSTT